MAVMLGDFHYLSAQVNVGAGTMRLSSP
jgi:hypothetical protein